MILNMEIKTLLSINGYTLLVGDCSNNRYCLSVIDNKAQVYECEGIYPTLKAANKRGYSVIRTLESLSQNSSS
jgi:hypothetical protein